MALGFTWGRALRALVLPQALRAVLPALVEQGIVLVKATSPATIVGAFALLGIAQSVVEQSEGESVPSGVVFAVCTLTALVYGVLPYRMSHLSRRLEPRRGVGTR